jgi:hypothetical protein
MEAVDMPPQVLGSDSCIVEVMIASRLSLLRGQPRNRRESAQKRHETESGAARRGRRPVHRASRPIFLYAGG